MSRRQASGTPAYGSDRGKDSTPLIRFDGVLSGGEVRSVQNRDEGGARDNRDAEGLNISTAIRRRLPSMTVTSGKVEKMPTKLTLKTAVRRGTTRRLES